MNFEWDDAKNDENIRNHFLDFSDAPEIFRGPLLTEVDDRFDYGEVRIKGIGLLKGIAVVIVFTERGDGTIRIISMRRAIKSERAKFYEFLKNRLG